MSAKDWTYHRKDGQPPSEADLAYMAFLDESGLFTEAERILDLEELGIVERGRPVDEVIARLEKYVTHLEEKHLPPDYD